MFQPHFDGEDGGIVDTIIEEQIPLIESECDKYLNDDGTINWEAHADNAWRLSLEAEAKIKKEIDLREKFQEKMTLPRVDKGRTVENIFRRLGDLTYNPDKITPNTYERMMLDAKISAALEGTARTTIGRGWEIVKGKKEHREFIHKMLDELKMNDVFFQVVIRTLQFGHTSTEKVYDIVDGKWIIKRYKVLISKDMRYKQTVTGIIKQYIQEVSVHNNFPSNSPPVINNREVQSSPFKTLRDRTFSPIKINHAVHNPMFGNPYGTSALKPVYKAWLLKDHMLRYWSRYLEIMGGGFLVGKSGSEKPKEFRIELDKAKASSTVGLRDDQELEIHWPPSKAPFVEKIKYYDSKIAEGLLFPDLLLGQNTDFGSRDLSETHFALFKLTRIDPTQQMLQEWIREDIRLLIDINFGQQEEYPELVFKAWSSLELEQRANFFRKLAMMQAIGTEDIWWIRRDLELPAIDKWEDIGDPLVKIQNQPGQASADGGGGDTTDSTDSTKREGVGTIA